jgi:hypothetical protein
VKVPLDIASFFNLSTQIHKEPNIKMKWGNNYFYR